MPSEAQERYEEAAALAADPAEAAHALHLGAAVAWGRHAGNEAMRLYHAAAEAARRADDPRRAALELASAAELVTNAPGIMSELPPPGEERALLGEALALAASDVHVEAAVLTVTTQEDESSTRRTPTWPNAPSSWPIGSATPGWRATRSTS